jgi:dihydroceramidase
MAAMVWSWDVSKSVAYSIYAGLLFAATAITVIYVQIRDPTFHQVAYAGLTALVLTRSIYLLTRVDNAEARKNMWWSIFIGVSSFVTGFILWIIDNEFCDALRSVRHQIGVPAAFLLGTPLLPLFYLYLPLSMLILELHGWW